MQQDDRRLTAREQRILCDLADPEGESLTADTLAGADILAILHAARDHNVEPVILRKLSALEFPNLAGVEEYRRSAKRDAMYLTAITLALTSQADRIVGALARENLPHAIVKGQTFARDIYSQALDRPFSDIDILVPKEALASAAKVMEALEFERFKRERFDKSEANEEQKWGYRGDAVMLAELHTNLVHVPGLRRRVSLGFEEYVCASANFERQCAGHFVVAVVHAGAGHKFHQLRLLVDVLQAVRRLSDPDLAHLADVVDDLRIHPEVSMSLSLVDALFPEAGMTARIAEIRETLRLPRIWPMVTARSVLESAKGGYWRSKIGRHAFRYYQMTLAPRRSLRP